MTIKEHLPSAIGRPSKSLLALSVLMLPILALAALAAPPAADAPTPPPSKFIKIAYPKANLGTKLQKINDQGQIIGDYEGVKGGGHSFLWDHGTYTLLYDRRTKLDMWSADINDQGQIVGSYYDAKARQHGCLWSKGVYTTIDFPHAPGGTYLISINNHGQIVGVYKDRDEGLHGFLWSGGVFSRIAPPDANTEHVYVTPWCINDQGEIVGVYGDRKGHGLSFLRSKGGSYTRLDFPDAVYTGFTPGLPTPPPGWTQARVVTSGGQVLGAIGFGQGRSWGFLWDRGIYTKINVPDSNGTDVYGMDGQGDVAGDYQDHTGHIHGFLWRDGVFKIIDFPEPTGNTGIEGINNGGQIVGDYYGEGLTGFGFLLNP